MTISAFIQSHSWPCSICTLDKFFIPHQAVLVFCWFLLLLVLICSIIIAWHTVWSVHFLSVRLRLTSWVVLSTLSCSQYYVFCAVFQVAVALAFFFDYCYSIVASMYRMYKVLVGELSCFRLNIQSVKCI